MPSGSEVYRDSTTAMDQGAATDGVCDVYVSYQGDTRLVPARFGQRLMEAIRDAGLPIAADCGGACTCATCHVYVAASDLDRLPAPGPNEAALLEVVDEPTSQSRLSCQIELDGSMVGLQVTLAPGSY